MKRFSKILTLILALVIIVTAFTVVALAEDAAEPKAVNVGGFRMETHFDHEYWTVGKVWGDKSGTLGDGDIMVNQAYPGGNKFLNITGSSTSNSSLRYNTFFGGVDGKTSYSIRSTYAFSNYPIAVLDFDIMTLTGVWGVTTGSNDNNSNNASLYFRPYIGGSQQKMIGNKKVEFRHLGLTKTPYEWSHVTVVYQYSEETVDNGDGTTTTTSYVTQTCYVNGVACEGDRVNGKTAVTVDNAQNMWFGSLYIQSSRYGAVNLAMDNIELTYCEAGYDVSKLPTAIYNDTWEAPFGKLLATVTVGEGEDAEISYFDDLGEAVAFADANPGSAFALASDMTVPYVVDREMTIDARKRDAEGNLTGEVYTGVIENARTNVGYLMVETETPGIYQSKLGDFMHTPSAGVGTAYTADQLAAKLRSPGSGSVIKLLNDIDFDPSLRLKTSGSSAGSAEEGAIGVTVDFTLDLNGHELRRVFYYGNEYVADENGVYPTEVTNTIAAKNTSLFDMENKAGVLKIVSTAATNGKIYNIGVKCNTYVKNGAVESREITSYVHAPLIYSITGGAVTDISNTDIYASKLLGGVWGNNFVTLKMNNCNFYQMTSGTANSISGNGEWIIHLRGNAGYDIQVENSLFYLNAPTPDGYMADYPSKYGTIGLLRVNEAAPDSATAIVNFKNCDIISPDNAHSAGMMNAGAADDIFLFENCRFYNNDTIGDGDLLASHGTLSNYWRLTESHAYPPMAAEGWTNETLANRISITYTVPDINSWTATTDAIQSVDFSFGTKEIVCQFNKIATKAIDVTFDGGDAIKLIPGVSDLYVAELRKFAEEDDNLLNKICIWQDAKENVYSSILGYTENGFVVDWENGYALTASEQTITIGGIEADFNLNFLTGFRYNLYIPVDERLSDVVVEGYAKSDVTVNIGGAAYTVYYKLVGSAAAAEDNVITATYKVDGAEYNQSWSINAIKYADMLLDNTAVLYPNEAAALGAMAKFIKEAVLYTNPEADVTAIDALIAKSGVASSYDTYTSGNVNALSDLSGIVESVQYVIYNGVASYKFTLAAEDTEIAFATAGGKNVEFDRDGKTVILSAMRVYDVIDALVITSGDKTATFAMVDYLTGMEGQANIDIVKALYEFGVAAEAYTSDLLAK